MLTFKKPSFYRLGPVFDATQRLRQDDRRSDDQRHDHRCGEDHVFALPPRPICRISRCVASCESNAREIPLVGEGTDATSSPDSPPGFCAIGAVAPWGATGIGGRVVARTGPAP